MKTKEAEMENATGKKKMVDYAYKILMYGFVLILVATVVMAIYRKYIGG
jgi:hypothetical protein